MKTFAALLLLALTPTVHADTLALPESSTAAKPGDLPVKGQSMDAVLHEYGSPRLKHPPVGGDSARHPPITRWDYDGYSVYLENRHVIAAVRPDAPTPIAHREQLTQP